MAKLFDVSDKRKSQSNARGTIGSRPSSRSSERSLPSRRIKKAKKRGNSKYGHKIIIDTGGDFSDSYPPQITAHRIKNTAKIRENTAPVPDVTSLTDKNFINSTMSGNLADQSSEVASNSLIASKNRMMAQQV